ncbi:MAG: helix-turn-helix domain-containing protein [Prevotella sp.]|nr:helix-turn-helix domain-containing protein [Prevotella sp.]
MGGIMLNIQQLKNYRQLRGLTQQDVSDYCDIGFSTLRKLESGHLSLNKRYHDKIVMGINQAYAAKKAGTLKSIARKAANSEKYPTMTAEEYANLQKEKQEKSETEISENVSDIPKEEESEHKTRKKRTVKKNVSSES